MGTMRQKRIFVYTTATCLLIALAGCDKGEKQRVELESVKAELETLKGTLRKVEADRDNLKTEVADLAEARDGLQTQVTTLSEEQTQMRSQIDQLTSTNKSLTEQVTTLSASNDQLAKQLKETTDADDKLKDQVSGLKTTNEQLKGQVAELTKQRDTAVAQLKESMGKIVTLTAKLRAATGAGPGPEVTPVVAEGTSSGEGTPPAPPVEPVDNPTVHSFSTARTKINKGQSATLSWHVSNAHRITIDPDIGVVTALGSRNVKPSKTTTYTLTATNASGETVETCKIEVR